MENTFNEDKSELNLEDIENIVKLAIHSILNENSFHSLKVNEWTNGIITQCLTKLKSLSKPYKYVITCIITEKTGAGLNTSTTFFWDNKNDEYCKVPWQNETIHCIVTVFAVSLNMDDLQESLM